ncbi:MAG: hypothetical protein MZU97_01095 [Bacillus subtilis]|nr:hypothetical protein [Bacillus subtilis]
MNNYFASVKPMVFSALDESSLETLADLLYQNVHQHYVVDPLQMELTMIYQDQIIERIRIYEDLLGTHFLDSESGTEFFGPFLKSPRSRARNAASMA